MSHQRRLYVTTGIMVLVTLIATMAVTWVLYNSHFERQRIQLTELAKSHAQMIEAVARFNLEANTGDETAARNEILSYLRNSQSPFPGLGETANDALAYLENGTFNWLFNQLPVAGEIQKGDIQQSTPSKEGTTNTAMREALKGRSGSLIELDARNVQVLAAYEPISALGLGYVTNISLSEIRAPYVKIGLAFTGMGLLMVLITSYLFHRMGQPVIQRLDAALAAFRKSHNEQESLVEERTAELQSELTMRELIEQSLIGAKKEADASSRAKSEFLANMSHELRTPLNSIIGFSDVLKMEMFGDLGSPKYKDYAGDINRSGTHLLDLINEILDVSKIEAGALSLDEQAFNLHQIVGECIDMVSERARQAELKITTEYSENLPNLIADPLRVKQMILNLLTNSIKFTPKFGTVHVSVHAHPDAGMEIEVADNGVGIDDKFLEQVLKPFGQGDRDATLTTQEGTGLGLPLVKMLIELHGGSMKLTSVKGQGTQVLLRFSKERVVRQPSEAFKK